MQTPWKGPRGFFPKDGGDHGEFSDPDGPIFGWPVRIPPERRESGSATNGLDGIGFASR